MSIVMYRIKDREVANGKTDYGIMKKLKIMLGMKSRILVS